MAAEVGEIVRLEQETRFFGRFAHRRRAWRLARLGESLEHVPARRAGGVAEQQLAFGCDDQDSAAQPARHRSMLRARLGAPEAVCYKPRAMSDVFLSYASADRE